LSAKIPESITAEREKLIKEINKIETKKGKGGCQATDEASAAPQG
jgi:hypothetical protein